MVVARIGQITRTPFLSGRDRERFDNRPNLTAAETQNTGRTQHGRERFLLWEEHPLSGNATWHFAFFLYRNNIAQSFRRLASQGRIERNIRNLLRKSIPRNWIAAPLLRHRGAPGTSTALSAATMATVTRLEAGQIA